MAHKECGPYKKVEDSSFWISREWFCKPGEVRVIDDVMHFNFMSIGTRRYWKKVRSYQLPGLAGYSLDVSLWDQEHRIRKLAKNRRK